MFRSARIVLALALLLASAVFASCDDESQTRQLESQTADSQTADSQTADSQTADSQSDFAQTDTPVADASDLIADNSTAELDDSDLTDTAQDVDQGDLAPLVTEMGPHSVGFRRIQVSYSPPDGTAERTLDVAVWYPSSQTQGDPGAYLNMAQPQVLADAALLSSDSDFPLHIHSHGHQGYAESLAPLMEYFASHGWVAVAPTHTGNTFLDGPNRETPIYYHRPFDVSYTLDSLFDLPNSDPLSGRLSDTNILLSGYSFGGYTAAALGGATYDLDNPDWSCDDESGPTLFCSTWTETAEGLFRAGFDDSRVGALVMIAAGDFDLFGDSGYATIDVDVLQIYGELDSGNLDTAASIWDALNPGSVQVAISEAGHGSMSDVCRLIPDFGLVDGCGEGFIEPSDAFLAINAYTLAFARHVLMEDDTVLDILDGTEEVTSFATARVK